MPPPRGPAAAPRVAPAPLHQALVAPDVHPARLANSSPGLAKRDVPFVPRENILDPAHLPVPRAVLESTAAPARARQSPSASHASRESSKTPRPNPRARTVLLANSAVHLAQHLHRHVLSALKTTTVPQGLFRRHLVQTEPPPMEAMGRAAKANAQTSTPASTIHATRSPFAPTCLLPTPIHPPVGNAAHARRAILVSLEPSAPPVTFPSAFTKTSLGNHHANSARRVTLDSLSPRSAQAPPIQSASYAPPARTGFGSKLAAAWADSTPTTLSVRTARCAQPRVATASAAAAELVTPSAASVHLHASRTNTPVLPAPSSPISSVQVGPLLMTWP